MKKKVLITGHKGYIGQHLWKMLQNNSDYDIYGLDINCDNQHKGDIRNIDYFGTSFHTIIHLAALVRVGESVKNPTSYYQTNVDGTLRILDRIPHHNFVFASTGAAEKPESPYGLSKRMAEDIVRERAYDFTTFRFYNVIGTDGFPPTNPDGLMLNLMNAIKTGEFNLFGNDYNTEDGTCIREYVHVNDICRALIKAIEKPSKSIENLAYGHPMSVNEIIKTFKEVNNVEFKVNVLPKRPGDLEACYLKEKSDYMERNYSYADMLRL